MNMKEKTPKAPLVKMNALDKVVAFIDPDAGLKRAHARARLSLVGGYKSGDRSRPALKRRGLSDGSADSEILPYVDKIRSDSRDLIRNEPLARGAVNTVVTNVVGTGLFPQARPDRDVLRARAGLTDEKIDEIERAFEREFRFWAGKKTCDATRTQTFAALQGLAFRSALESGDVFAVNRFIKRVGARYSTAIQLIEADRVANPIGKSDGPLLCAGVERDQYGAAIAYHVTKSHPGNRYLVTGRYETVRFPAYFDNGEWQVLHMMFKERPEQTRGVPFLAPVIEPLMQLGKYTEAEVMSAVVSSLFTVFVKTEDGSGLAPLNTDTASSQKDDELELGSGSILDLAPGEDVTFANPGRPNAQFDPFVMSVLRQIGTALEIPFELLIKHFTASYSAAQAALLEAWKAFRARRVWLVDEFAQPCYEAVLSEAVARGYVSAPGFFSDPLVRQAYLVAEWIGPPRGMIDQLKEAKANEICVANGWKTGQEVTAELTGGDFDRKHERLVKEREMRSSAGLTSPGEREPDPTVDELTDTDTDKN